VEESEYVVNNGRTEVHYTRSNTHEIKYYTRVNVVLAKFHVPSWPNAAICSGHTLARLDTRSYLLHTYSITIYIIWSLWRRRLCSWGGGVNKFFVGQLLIGGWVGCRPRGTALLTCRFGIKWTCNTPYLNRFHIITSSSFEPPPWVGLSHLNRHNTAKTYTHNMQTHYEYLMYSVQCTYL